MIKKFKHGNFLIRPILRPTGFTRPFGVWSKFSIRSTNKPTPFFLVSRPKQNYGMILIAEINSAGMIGYGEIDVCNLSPRKAEYAGVFCKQFMSDKELELLEQKLCRISVFVPPSWIDDPKIGT